VLCELGVVERRRLRFSDAVTEPLQSDPRDLDRLPAILVDLERHEVAQYADAQAPGVGADFGSERSRRGGRDVGVARHRLADRIEHRGGVADRTCHDRGDHQAGPVLSVLRPE
jgi:hypothetical protein